MGARSTAVLASGTASTVKLLVAALTFTAAYAGVSAYDTARPTSEPVRTVTLSAVELPVTLPVTTVVTPEAGTVSVAPLSGGSGCDKPFLMRGLLVNPDPAEGLLYGWRLTRWNASTRGWKTYDTSQSGFAGERRTVEWEAHVVDNPGWYRAELTVDGGKTVRSQKFLVSC